MKKIFFLVVIVVYAFSASLPAFAVTGQDTWVGNSSVNLGDSNWTGTNNPPLPGDSWIFNTAGSSGNSLNNNFTLFPVNGITYNSGADAFTINGNSLTLTGDIDNNSSSNETLGMGIASGAIINSGTGSGSVSITGGVSSNVTAIKENSSSSALTISINPLTVNGGSGTTLTNNSSGSSLLTVSGGVTGSGNLILGNDSSINGGITLSTVGVNNTGTITNSGTGSGNTLISSSIGSNVTGVIQNSATSALILTGNNTTYSGPTTLVAGTLNLGSANAMGTGIINLDGGTLQYSASNTTDYSSQFSA